MTSIETTSLCHSNDIPEGGTIGLVAGELSLLAAKKRGQIYLYRNSCPHIGIRLEWQANQFLNIDKSLIQCANHGALFTIEEGNCVAGPCSGQSLEAVPFELRNGELFLV